MKRNLVVGMFALLIGVAIGVAVCSSYLLFSKPEPTFPAIGMSPAVLVVDGWEMINTGDDKNFLINMLIARTLNCHDQDCSLSNFKLESFLADILQADPKTHRVTKWKKERGWSLWERIPEQNGRGNAR